MLHSRGYSTCEITRFGRYDSLWVIVSYTTSSLRERDSAGRHAAHVGIREQPDWQENWGRNMRDPTRPFFCPHFSASPPSVCVLAKISSRSFWRLRSERSGGQIAEARVAVQHFRQEFRRAAFAAQAAARCQSRCVGTCSSYSGQGSNGSQPRAQESAGLCESIVTLPARGGIGPASPRRSQARQVIRDRSRRCG